MGVSTSQYQQLNESINTAMMNVIVQNTSQVESSAIMENTITLGVVRGKVSGIDQSNLLKVNVQLLSTMVSNGSIQSLLQQAVENTIKEKASTIGYSSSEAQIKNIVRNAIDVNINNTTMSELKNLINQKNQITVGIVEDTGVLQNISQSNSAEMVAKLISNTSSDIIAGLSADSNVKNAIEIEKSNPISDVISGISNLFSGPIFMILIIIIVVAVVGLVGWFTVKKFMIG